MESVEEVEEEMAVGITGAVNPSAGKILGEIVTAEVERCYRA